ncbi:unnamed protein product [Ambrosiozyma monospora]|uniref:Unnamed protein product n=1 Tax=Ambrosiozyma monospora TaxID=43982 RepID=A0ACB5T1M4_AMBMO|nr:unnamed protein product [Ambrosiozyma monospora]
MDKLASKRLTGTSTQSTIRNKLLDPNQPGISKSAIRRRRRKQRDQLKPKLDDLLDALQSTVTPTDTDTQMATGSNDDQITSTKVKLSHKPNPNASLKGAKKVEIEEGKRFGLVLKDPSFKASPFSALKDAILKNSDKY